jgi:hypothetical protein
MQNNDAPGIAKTDILRHNQKHRHDDPAIQTPRRILAA